jgi:putative Holliday junction resolvase
MRVLALDLGTRRIGLAISDPDAIFAFPLNTLETRGRDRDIEALRQVIAEHEVERVVIGLPLHLDGHAGPEARSAREFADALAEQTGLHVDTLDERWTTAEAERALRETGRKHHKQREVVDSVAASIILRTYLELQQAERETRGESE